MQTVDRPALPGLDWGGLAFGGDVSIEAQQVEQVAGLARVLAAVEVHVRELVVTTQVAVLRQGADHVDDSGQCGLQQRRVVVVGPGGNQVQRDSLPIGGDGALHALFAPVNRGTRPGSVFTPCS
jgi:hypothetical protein